MCVFVILCVGHITFHKIDRACVLSPIPLFSFSTMEAFYSSICILIPLLASLLTLSHSDSLSLYICTLAHSHTHTHTHTHTQAHRVWFKCNYRGNLNSTSAGKACIIFRHTVCVIRSFQDVSKRLLWMKILKVC